MCLFEFKISEDIPSLNWKSMWRRLNRSPILWWQDLATAVVRRFQRRQSLSPYLWKLQLENLQAAKISSICPTPAWLRISGTQCQSHLGLSPTLNLAAPSLKVEASLINGLKEQKIIIK